jgi:hypothetical protein
MIHSTSQKCQFLDCVTWHQRREFLDDPVGHTWNYNLDKAARYSSFHEIVR